MKTLFTYISVLLTVVSYCPVAISSPAHNVPLPQCAKDAAREAGAEQRLFEAVIAYEFGIKTDRVPATSTGCPLSAWRSWLIIALVIGGKRLLSGWGSLRAV